jgi:polygalacturonase
MKRNVFTCQRLALLSTAIWLSQATAADPARVYDVRALGAKGDGRTLDTAAIQKALTDCGKAGGGIVRFPPGTYLSQPLTLGTKTTVILEQGAKLLASPDHRHFMKTPGDWLKASGGSDFIPLLSGKDLVDITIKGKGVIDGNGAVWWEEAEKARQKVSGYTLPRPNLFALQRCRNVKLAGITLQNSPKFHFVPSECEEVMVDGVTVLAPERAANTDGIDPSNCRNVTITKCLIDVGDDNIAIKSGKKVEGREFGCENITVTNCTFKHGHGMSIGSETVGGVRNVLVQNCTFENTDNGLRIKSRRERGGTVENITYTDCALSNCHPAISIMAYYQNSTHGKFPRDDAAQPLTDTTPIFRNIVIRNISGNSTSEVGLIVGLPESPVRNVLIENVTINGREGLIIGNAKEVIVKGGKITAQKGGAFVLHNAEVSGLPEVTGTK